MVLVAYGRSSVSPVDDVGKIKRGRRQVVGGGRLYTSRTLSVTAKSCSTKDIKSVPTPKSAGLTTRVGGRVFVPKDSENLSRLTPIQYQSAAKGRRNRKKCVGDREKVSWPVIYVKVLNKSHA